ncbi:MAG: LysR substrate-binding domain-containing protein [Pseudomonadota bacterium]
MIRSLPFTSLRAFEAVARLGSFSDAALELSVSQSAVSQQVKALEEWLGQPLLLRAPRRTRPTEEGARLAAVVADGLGEIAQVCERMRDKRRGERKLTISCLPGFAFIWLFPRLLNFDLAHPNLSISVTTDTGGRGFAVGQADVGIRYGSGDNPGFAVEPLMDEVVTPVCAPDLIRPETPLRTVEDLRHHTVLRDEFSPFTRSPPTWEFWAETNRLTLPEPARTRRFGQSHMVVQAAISGLGVALGRTPLVSPALEDGRLIQPFAQSARAAPKYWLVYEERARDSERITPFLEWIKAEAAGADAIPRPSPIYI